MESLYTLLTIGLFRQGTTVFIELSHQDPRSQGVITPCAARSP